jgi:hypothetical protein
VCPCEKKQYRQHYRNEGGDAATIDHVAGYSLGCPRRAVPQDYVMAHKWYNLAASSADASEKTFRDVATRNRDRMAEKMTPAQIAEAQKLAREWKPEPDR